MEKNLGVYIHIPFCVGKCAYCDFYSLAGHEKLMPAYQHALLYHIKEYEPQLDGYLSDTVYFGGGTPSYYGSDRLISIFNPLKNTVTYLLEAEVTAEVNPDSVTKADLVRMRRAGFNRLSIGVQSANDALLKSLGRRHNFAAAEETVKNAREAGFENISIDLIYGLPSQSRDSWADTFNRAASLKPEHISCYGLKIEEGSQLYIYKDSPSCRTTTRRRHVSLCRGDTSGLGLSNTRYQTLPGADMNRNITLNTGSVKNIWGLVPRRIPTSAASGTITSPILKSTAKMSWQAKTLSI
jgi:oxygen-independent coproporphyrinogen-3 oxidase